MVFVFIFFSGAFLYFFGGGGGGGKFFKPLFLGFQNRENFILFKAGGPQGFLFFFFFFPQLTMGGGNPNRFFFKGLKGKGKGIFFLAFLDRLWGRPHFIKKKSGPFFSWGDKGGWHPFTPRGEKGGGELLFKKRGANFLKKIPNKKPFLTFQIHAFCFFL